ncbi:MAG: alpha/beta fold hydrolase [Nitrososphaerales archaeon]
MKAKFDSFNGIRTRYFESGKGPNVVLIHGGQFGSYDNAVAWSLNINELAQKFHVVAFDKFGMGYTDGPLEDKDFTMQTTINHANLIINKLGVDKFALVGHSRGGLVAARMSLLYPKRITALTIVDSNTLAPDDPSLPHDFYSKLEKKARTPETRESSIRELEANSFSKEHITRELKEEWFKVASLPSIISIRKRFNGFANPNVLSDLVQLKRDTLAQIESRKLKAPTLIVWGNNDPSAPVSLSHRLFEIVSKSVSNCQLHIFNRAGHYSFREKASDFNLLTMNFFLSANSP